jgi:serine/threonine-protein kinase RsbW
VSETEHSERVSPDTPVERCPGAVDDPGLLIYERVLPAVAKSVGRIRGELVDRLALHELAGDRRADMALVVTEAATNAVLHAYRHTTPGPLYVAATLDRDCITLGVSDFGCGMVPRADSPGLGFGVALMTQLSDHLQISSNADGGGTCVTATFARLTPTAARPADHRHAPTPSSGRREILLEYLHALRAANVALREDTDAVLAQADLAVARARRQRHERALRT